MTNEFKYLMYLYACAAKSVSASPLNYDVDFYKLYEMADRMSLLSTMSYALKISPQVDCPDEIKQKLYSVMLGTSLKNKIRTQAVLKTLEDIENKGIKAVVLKGIDCARYYSKPECRISADTDLLIDEKDEEKLLQYFEQNGYTVQRRKKYQHHSECVSKHTGMFEIHVKIWEDYVYDAMRGSPENIRINTESSMITSVDNTKIRVLNQTDAMIFMTLHLVKHFMFSNANLKMSYDLALYYINNKEHVDKDKYKKWLA
ncbi:MAG: nucleotidyltransferase family protein, partial [Eubacteriales bacterium]|nr:nucleotidyltransferase family protein [Eubacteriales bacterium]